MKHAEIASELFSKRYFMGIWDFIQDEILFQKWQICSLCLKSVFGKLRVEH